MFREAEEQFARVKQIEGETIGDLAALGHTYALSGKKGAATEVLARLKGLSKERYVSPYELASIHAALGETDEAFRLLKQCYNERVEWMIYTNIDPRLDPLRADPRFSELLERLGFAPDPSIGNAP